MSSIGTWDIQIVPKIGSRSRNATLAIRSEGDGLAGEINSKTGRELVRNVQENDNNLQFEVGRKIKDKDVTFSYLLVVEGDSLSGTARLGNFDAAKVVGNRRKAVDSSNRVLIGAAPKSGVDINESLIFVISPPRSGSTLTTRMLASHPEIFATPELHLLPPLYHLGYYNPAWREGNRAEYDSLNSDLDADAAGDAFRSYNKVFASYGIKSIVEWLPNFEEDYLDALRAYTNTIYAKLLDKSGKNILLDKTPQYSRYADFITKLYPRARYIALTRHPVQTALSIRKGMRDMKTRELSKRAPNSRDSANKQVEEAALSDAALANFGHYLRGMLDFLRQQRTEYYRLKYENLVRSPEIECEKICAYLGIEYTPAMLEYDPKGYAMPGIVGDPYTVSKYNKPNPDLLKKLSIGSEADLDFACAVLELLTPEEFGVLGYDAKAMLQEVEEFEAAYSG